MAKRMRRTHDTTPDDEQTGAENGDISFPEQILQVSDERADGGDGEGVGDGQPADGGLVADVVRDVGQGCAGEVEEDLGAWCSIR